MERSHGIVLLLDFTRFPVYIFRSLLVQVAAESFVVGEKGCADENSVAKCWWWNFIGLQKPIISNAVIGYAQTKVLTSSKNS